MREGSAAVAGIAIVLATGRDSPFVAEALQPVRVQTFRSWELVIVDNGVDDLEALTTFIMDEPRARLVRIAHSATVGEARNVGVAHTVADLVTFIDDDDVWDPARLERHIAAHAAHPAAPAVVSGYWHMDAEGHRFGRDWEARPATPSDILRGARPTPVCGALSLPREHFVAVGGLSDDVPLMGDFELILKLARRGEFAFVEELLMGYRRHAANITSTNAANARLRRHTMMEMVERQRWTAEARGDQELAHLLAERLRRQARDYGRDAARRTLQLLWRMRFADAVADAMWGLRYAPGAYVAGAIAATVRRP